MGSVVLFICNASGVVYSARFVVKSFLFRIENKIILLCLCMYFL